MITCDKSLRQPFLYEPVSRAPTTIHISTLLRRLRSRYGEAECALDHTGPFQLLAATILSAQCTDKRVNLVTPQLFERFATPEALASADLLEVEELIHSTGFFRNKARNLIGMAQVLVAEFGGLVPNDMNKLLTLPGVARKTANVVLGVAFGQAEGVVVDTHVTRLTHIWGLTSHDDPKKIEEDLMVALPKRTWIDFSHRVIHHGRALCIARRPLCSACFLQDICPKNGV